MKKFTLLTICVCAVLAKDNVSLKDIVVTAQKTEENIFEVPISISYFDNTSIYDKNIKDLEHLSYFVPNFNVINLGFGPYQPVIRGVDSYRQALSKSVGLYIDGALRFGGVGYENILDDVERVEVLRGPQGTLYGGGSEAGVINVITKKPDNITQGKIGLEIGENNKQRLNLSFSKPLIEDSVFLGISGNYYKKDGYMKDAISGKSTDDRKNYYAKAYLRATPTERLELSLISSVYKTDDGGMSRNSLQAKDIRVYYADLEEKMENSYYSFVFNAKYDFNDIKFSSTSVYVKDKMKNAIDNDLSSKKILHSYTNAPTRTISEEFKVDGKYKNLQYLAGLFIAKAKKDFIWRDDSIMPARSGKNRQDITEKNLGFFTHLNYAFNAKLNLIGGIRFDKDVGLIKDFKRKFSGKENFNNISPKVAIEYKIKPNFMTYATIAKGYRMGGFFPYAPENLNKYKSESLINYELGFKSYTLDNSLWLNADIFYMDFKDKQTQAFINKTQSYIANAPKAKIYGLEIDSNYNFNNNLSFFATFGLVKAKFGKFKDYRGDFSNNKIPFAPAYNYSLGAKFRGFAGFYASSNLRGYGKMYLDESNKFEQKAYALVDAKIGYEWENFDIYLYANNLFDKNYDLKGYAGRYILLNPQREVGLKIAYRF